MTDIHFNRILNDRIADKYICKYIHKSKLCDDDIKADIRQELYLILLEAMQKPDYQDIEDKFSYLCGIMKNQLYSRSSDIYRKYFMIKDNHEINYNTPNQLTEK